MCPFIHTRRISHTVILITFLSFPKFFPDPLLSPHTQLCVLFLKLFLKPPSLMCCPNTLRYVTIRWSMADLAGAKFLKKTEFSHPIPIPFSSPPLSAVINCQDFLSYGCNFMPTFPIHLPHADILSGACTGLVHAVVNGRDSDVSYPAVPKKHCLVESHTTSNSFTLTAPSSTGILIP